MDTLSAIPFAGITSDKKLNIAGQFLLSLRQHDWQLLASLHAEDAGWFIPGDHAFSGIATGLEEIIATAKAMVNYNGSMQVNNIQLSYVGFALSLSNRITKEGIVFEEHLTITAALNNGKITSVSFFSADIAGLNRFLGGKPLNTGQLRAATMDQKQNAANTFITAMKSNDWALMRSVMADDISWTLPGHSLLSGPANGVDAVINRAQSLKKFGVMFDLLYILYGWDGVALSLHNTAKRDTLILDEYVTIAFQLNGGQITGITTHLSDVPGIEAFFVPGII